MPLTRFLAALLALLCLDLFAASSATAAPVRAATEVGYETLSIPDPEGPPVQIGIWYPATGAASPRRMETFTEQVVSGAEVVGNHLPLVVISHGNGGSFTGHVDTAMALAKAGFVVASLTHTGDNFRDQSRATDMANRPRQLKLLIDYMVASWPQHARIDPRRIGAFGFSSGGFTVLTAAGGEPDLKTVTDHCRIHPDYFDCTLIAKAPGALVAPDSWTHDTRIRAVVSAAPALGFAFGRAGLTKIKASVQLWRAADDHILPNPDYAEAVRLNLPRRPEYHVVAGADHFDFLPPCSEILRASAQPICTSALDFDRTRFHQQFNNDVVTFFRKSLSR